MELRAWAWGEVSRWVAGIPPAPGAVSQIAIAAATPAATRPCYRLIYGPPPRFIRYIGPQRGIRNSNRNRPALHLLPLDSRLSTPSPSPSPSPAACCVVHVRCCCCFCSWCCRCRCHCRRRCSPSSAGGHPATSRLTLRYCSHSRRCALHPDLRPVGLVAAAPFCPAAPDTTMNPLSVR